MSFIEKVIKNWSKWFSPTIVSPKEEVQYELTPVPLLELGPGVYDTYLNTVKKRNYYTMDYVQKKLTRNVLLAMPLEQKKKDRTLYLYGNLEILVVGDTIVWIRNNKGSGKFDSRRRGWRKDLTEHKRIGALLGI